MEDFVYLQKGSSVHFIGSRPKLQQVCDQVYRKNPLSIAKPYEIIDQKSFLSYKDCGTIHGLKMTVKVIKQLLLSGKD